MTAILHLWWLDLLFVSILKNVSVLLLDTLIALLHENSFNPM